MRLTDANLFLCLPLNDADKMQIRTSIPDSHGFHIPGHLQRQPANKWYQAVPGTYSARLRVCVQRSVTRPTRSSRSSQPRTSCTRDQKPAQGIATRLECVTRWDLSLVHDYLTPNVIGVSIAITQSVWCIAHFEALVHKHIKKTENNGPDRYDYRSCLSVLEGNSTLHNPRPAPEVRHLYMRSILLLVWESVAGGAHGMAFRWEKLGRGRNAFSRILFSAELYFRYLTQDANGNHWHRNAHAKCTQGRAAHRLP